MKYNQNFKISQITDNTLVIGVDIAKKKHYARAFDYRGIELDKVFKFKATSSGFYFPEFQMYFQAGKGKAP